MVRWFDFRGDDFHRPHTITHLGAGLSKNLCTLLRTLPGIGDDLNRMLRKILYCYAVFAWLVQFYLLPLPKELKIKVLRLLTEDGYSKIG